LLHGGGVTAFEVPPCLAQGGWFAFVFGVSEVWSFLAHGAKEGALVLFFSHGAWVLGVV